MNKKTKIIIGIIGILISILILFELYSDEDFVILEHQTKISGDVHLFEIKNFTVYTFNTTFHGSSENNKLIGSGFINNDNASKYQISFKSKNIANRTIDRVEFEIKYYNTKNELLKSFMINNKFLKTLVNKSEEFTVVFIQTKWTMKDFKNVDHITIHIKTTFFPWE